jgi:hypothetical protein
VLKFHFSTPERTDILLKAIVNFYHYSDPILVFLGIKIAFLRKRRFYDLKSLHFAAQNTVFWYFAKIMPKSVRLCQKAHNRGRQNTAAHMPVQSEYVSILSLRPVKKSA